MLAEKMLIGKELALNPSRDVVCQPTEVLDDARAQALERWNGLVSHSRSQKPWVSVRWIDRMRDAMSSYMGVDVGAARVHEGPNSIALMRRQHSQAASARATQDTDKHGFGAVVRVMPGSNTLRAHAE